MSIFETLNKINVNDKTEQKNGLTYLSWAWAWGEVKKACPEAMFTIYERETEYGPVNYFTDGRTCWVKTGLTIEGLEHIEELPVMDFKNRAIPLDQITSTDVNKAIQRSLTKAAARHGLGLYIYAGEDLPEEESEARKTRLKEEEQKSNRRVTAPPATATVNAVNTLPPVNEDDEKAKVKNFIKLGLGEMKVKFKISSDKEMKETFSKMRGALIQGGVIPDIKSEDLTIEQAKQMFDAIYKNFLPDGEAS